MKNTYTTKELNQAILSEHDGEQVDQELLEAAWDYFRHAIVKAEAKAQANRELYEKAHDVLMDVLTDPHNKPEVAKTTTELMALGAWPEGFTKNKLSYAMRELWNDEVERIENGRSPLTYRIKK